MSLDRVGAIGAPPGSRFDSRLTVTGATTGSLFQANIAGTGGLTMAGSGTASLSLYGTQSYSGGTSVSGGTCIADAPSALGSGAVTVALSPAIAWLTMPQNTFSVAFDLSGTSGTVQILQLSYDPAFLGSWGRDTTTNVVWAVVDHKSDFVVIARARAGSRLVAALGLSTLLVGGVRAARRTRGVMNYSSIS